MGNENNYLKNIIKSTSIKISKLGQGITAITAMLLIPAIISCFVFEYVGVICLTLVIIFELIMIAMVIIGQKYEKEDD